MPFNLFNVSAKGSVDKANVEVSWAGKKLLCATFDAETSVNDNGVFASVTAV